MAAASHPFVQAKGSYADWVNFFTAEDGDRGGGPRPGGGTFVFHINDGSVLQGIILGSGFSQEHQQHFVNFLVIPQVNGSPGYNKFDIFALLLPANDSNEPVIIYKARGYGHIPVELRLASPPESLDSYEVRMHNEWTRSPGRRAAVETIIRRRLNDADAEERLLSEFRPIQGPANKFGGYSFKIKKARRLRKRRTKRSLKGV
jgi:hypothetical protein